MKHVFIIEIVTKSGLYIQRRVFKSKNDAYDFGKFNEVKGFEFILKREKIY